MSRIVFGKGHDRWSLHDVSTEEFGETVRRLRYGPGNADDLFSVTDAVCDWMYLVLTCPTSKLACEKLRAIRKAVRSGRHHHAGPDCCDEEGASEVRPNPVLLKTLERYVGRWICVDIALPPELAAVLVAVRGDNCPAYAWLTFSAGDRDCPYFVCPQVEAMEPRGAHHTKPEHAKRRCDVTHWFAPTAEGLPHLPPFHESAAWGLGGMGWEEMGEPAAPCPECGGSRQVYDCSRALVDCPACTGKEGAP